MSVNSTSTNIAIRRVQLTDPSQMPTDYGTTPGGTMYSTTPGGTRIIYDRQFMLKLRDSPSSKATPKLPDIPGVTLATPEKRKITKISEETNGKEKSDEDHQFDMEM